MRHATEGTTLTKTLGWILAALMALQSVLGLAFHSTYRDVAWIDATWWGNDLVTLVVALPLLAWALSAERGNGARARLIAIGGFAYGAYNYAYYMLGASLNSHFLIYVAAFIVSCAGLISALARPDFGAFVETLALRRGGRPIGSYLIFVAAGLSTIWIGMWAAYAFAGRPTPVEPEAFRLVAALDLSLMVPVLALAGMMLWHRRSWGIAIGALASVQSSLYLLVLSVNSAIAIKLGLAEAPGELVIWLPLFVCTTIAACALLAGVRQSNATD